MALKTNLNRNPYFLDYDPSAKYYDHLFKPGVSVQVRELNGIQAQLQNQIEKFADNIFKSGTIVSGCNFSFYPNYSYVKLADNNLTGVPIAPETYVGLFVKDSDNLTGYIMNAKDGYETNDPDLKTIFVNYINSGDSGAKTSFTSGSTLTVFDTRKSIFAVTVDNGGLGFSNSDTLVISPSIEVAVDTGSFSNGDYITDPVYGSNCQIIGIHDTDDANTFVFDLKPRTTDLANALANSFSWTFGELNDIVNSGNTASGTVVKIHGQGAAGKVITNGVGRITSIFFTYRGEGYDYIPYVTVKSANNSSGISSLALTAQNYFDKIKVATVADPVGNGYAFGVSEGVIYQLGRFLKVDKQVIVVNSYSSSPNNVSVGFVTAEDIVNHNIDSSLLDNAIGTENETAPGADRMRLTPTLKVFDTIEVSTNSEIFALVSWNDGNPYRQNQVSIYSKIGDEMATRMSDQSGSFVIDPFLVTSASVANSQIDGNTFTMVVDPGEAYIDGYHVQTLRNSKIDVPKATDVLTTIDKSITMNYDAFLRVKELGGLFQFSTGDTIDFYSSAKTYLSNTSLAVTGNTTPQGSKIGTARIRSLLLEDGIAGDANAIYRAFLFNVQMNSGKNFRDVRSIYYNGTNKGIADAILEPDATTGANIAVLRNAVNDTLVFKTGAESIRNTNAASYVYRTIDQTTATANAGTLTKSIAGNPNEVYPYSSPLSDADLRSLYVVPIGNNLIAYTALTGTVSVNTTSANAVGSGTTFLVDLVPGDYVSVGNSTANAIKKVVSVPNNTLIVLDSNCSFANSSANIRRTFPKNIPVPFGTRSGLSANLDVNRNILTLDFGMTFEGTVSVNTALGVNIQRTGVSATSKTANRNQYVKLRLANNAANTVGPWCLGVSDAFRLRNVFVGTLTVNTNSTDIGSEFFIDANHNPNYCDLSYLHLNPKSSVALASSDYLLVCFDYFSRADDGYFDTASYLGTSNTGQIANLNSLPLANLTTAAASFEVPEFYDNKGNYYDLLNCIDFRPAVVNTVAMTATPASAAINPAYALSFGNTADPANDKKFPLPDSTITLTTAEYMGRTDAVVVGPDGNIIVQQGVPNTDPKKRIAPLVSSDNLLLNKIIVPPYPNYTINPSNNVVDIVDTQVMSRSKRGTRLDTHKVVPIVANTITSVPSQPKGYTMANIGELERRIRDLEYYTSLSLLETSITNKVIPSSVDGTLNRFKFGFMADDFSTQIHSDLTNPQYAAEIEVVKNVVLTNNTTPKMASNLCVPKKFRWGVNYKTEAPTMPYVDYYIVSQSNATDGTDIIHPNCTPISITTTNTVTVNAVVITTNTVTSNTLTTANGLVYAKGVHHVAMNCYVSSVSGNATMFFNFLGDPYIEIYQANSTLTVNNFRYSGGTVISSKPGDLSNARLVITSASAVDLTATDKAKLKANAEMSQFWKTSPSVYTGHLSRNPNDPGWVWGAGKIEFTHNPAYGQYYAIYSRTLPGISTRIWEMVEYPKDHWVTTTTQANVTTIVPVTQNVVSTTVIPCGGTGGGPTQYAGRGSVTYNGPVQFTGTNATNVSGNILCEFTGLMPNTVHKFYVNGVECPELNRAISGGNPSDLLKSDASGMLFIKYTETLDRIAQKYFNLSSYSVTDEWININHKTTIMFNVVAPNSNAGANLAIATADLS